MQQNRRLIYAIMASMTVFYLYLLVVPRFFPPMPSASVPTTRPATQPATQPAGTDPPSVSSTAPAEKPATQAAPAAAATSTAGEVTVQQGASLTLTRLGSAEAGNPFPMLLEIDPVGADVVNAWLRDHYQTVKKKEAYHILSPIPLDTVGQMAHSFATPQLRFDNRRIDVPLDRYVWALDPASGPGRQVWTLQVNGADGRPLARVYKTYELPEQPTGTGTYDLKLSLKVENLSGEPARLIVEQRGPVGFQKEDPRTEDRRVVGATWQGGEVVVKGHMRTDILKSHQLALGNDLESNRVAWAAEGNKYFACIMAPAGRSSGDVPAVYSSVEAVHLTQNKDESPDLTYRFVSNPIEVAAGASAELAFDCYVGPKSKTAFQRVDVYEKRDYYAVIRESFYFCAPAGLTSLMMALLNFFYRIGFHNYGIAIIILVLVVRAILHPITKKSQVNMMQMQKQMARLQPRIEAVKAKYAGDRGAMNQAMMEVYKEEGVNPAGNLLTCLPLMLQIPIWGALWQALASTIEMRHAPFDGWWIKDLAGQDALVSFADKYPAGIDIPIISWMTGPILAFNLLPILLGISQLLQAKYMPRATPPGAQPSGPAADQFEQQRKMMMFMSGFFVLMLYSAPSGLNLYIMASNIFGILEQWRIRKHIADLDAKQAAAPAAAVPAKRPSEPERPKKPSWLQKKWEELQKQAEEARRVQGQKKKDR